MNKKGFAVFYSHIIAGLIGRSFSYAVFSNRPAAQEYADSMNDSCNANHKYSVVEVELKPVIVKGKKK